MNKSTNIKIAVLDTVATLMAAVTTDIGECSTMEEIKLLHDKIFRYSQNICDKIDATLGEHGKEYVPEDLTMVHWFGYDFWRDSK